MVKITGKDVANLCGLTEPSLRVILARQGIRLRQQDLEKLIDFIAQRRRDRELSPQTIK